MGLVKTRRLAAMQKQQRAKATLKAAIKKPADVKPPKKYAKPIAAILVAIAFSSPVANAAGQVCEMRDIFGIPLLGSAEYDNSTATNAVSLYPGSVLFRLAPWREFTPSTLENVGQHLATATAKSEDFTDESAAKSLYDETGRYFDDCTNLVKREGSVRQGYMSRYWIGKDPGTELTIAVFLWIAKGRTLDGGERYTVYLRAGEVGKMFYLATSFGPRFGRRTVEENVQTSRFEYGNPALSIDAIKAGDIGGFNGFMTDAHAVKDGLNYIKDSNGDEKLVAAYLHYSGHDHRLEILLPKPGDKRATYVFTVTDLNFGEPKLGDGTNSEILGRLGREMKERRKTACAKRMRDKDYHGTWGYSYEFNICVFQFDRSGIGMVSIGMGGAFFDWDADDNGTIRCKAKFPNMTKRNVPPDEVVFTLQYNPDKNEMKIVSVEAEADEKLSGMVLNSKPPPLMSDEVHVKEAQEQYKKVEAEMLRRRQAVIKGRTTKEQRQ